MLRSIAEIGRRRLAGFLLVTGGGWLLTGTAAADPTVREVRCTINPQSPTIDLGETVAWSASVSGIRAGRATYDWSFEEGNPGSSTDASPTVSYNTQNGTFQTTLKVKGRRGEAECGTTISVSGSANLPPTADAGGPNTGSAGSPVAFDGSGSSDPDGTIVSYTWDFGDGSSGTGATPSHTYANAGSYTATLTVTDDDGASASASTTATITEVTACPPEVTPPQVSINSTSQDSECQAAHALSEQPPPLGGNYSLLAINDLGMHCGDLDTRIASILPPFQVLLAQILHKGAEPMLNPSGVRVYYSAASNPADPILSENLFPGLKADGSTYKTNFWDTVLAGAYDPFYPATNPFTGDALTPLADPPFNVGLDVGLPVPNLEELYIGADGVVDQHCDTNPGNCDGTLTAVQHTMPGLASPYAINEPQEVQEHYGDKPFFVNFPFGYVAEDVNWYEGAGVPFAAFDDFGRENAYPLARVQATIDGNPPNGANVVASLDTVLPISGEASCTNCHTTLEDYESVHGPDSGHRTEAPVTALSDADVPLPVATSMSDPDFGDLPPIVSLEYAADLNILRLHDLNNGKRYVSTACDAPGQNCLNTAPATCDITANGGDGDGNCLTNKALHGQPVVCQVCHYTPALDLAQVGPKAGDSGTEANGRNQVAHQSNSRVMHNHHGQFTALFPAVPEPNQDPITGAITNQAERLAALEDSCYQCHPGKHTRCLRGAMFNAGMLCNDCHGTMEQVGADFSAGVSPVTPGAFVLDPNGDFYDPGDPQPRVPWANEPGCGSCHTGDATSNMAGLPGTLVNSVDTNGNADDIRLRQAYRIGDGKATPIVPTNKRFAEPAVPASFGGFANPGAGNPKLYRVSTGHGGVFCEGCHGATHAEWPNAKPNANDNLAATQIQGHTGAITECGSCHGTGWEPSSSQALGGPHGMHVVGDTNFSHGGHEHIAESNNGQACFACHGGTSRRNSEGTVLSRAAMDRTLHGEGRTVQVAKGDPVGCILCHSGSGD